jgi:hypothetical protein
MREYLIESEIFSPAGPKEADAKKLAKVISGKKYGGDTAHAVHLLVKEYNVWFPNFVWRKS